MLRSVQGGSRHLPPRSAASIASDDNMCSNDVRRCKGCRDDNDREVCISVDMHDVQIFADSSHPPLPMQTSSSLPSLPLSFSLPIYIYVLNSSTWWSKNKISRISLHTHPKKKKYFESLKWILYLLTIEGHMYDMALVWCSMSNATGENA